METWRSISKIVGKLWPKGCLPRSKRTETVGNSADFELSPWGCLPRSKRTENRRKISLMRRKITLISNYHPGDICQGSRERKTVGKLRLFRDIPSSSSELVGFIWSACWKNVPSHRYSSLWLLIRLTEFFVNSFYSAYNLSNSGGK